MYYCVRCGKQAEKPRPCLGCGHHELWRGEPGEEIGFQDINDISVK